MRKKRVIGLIIFVLGLVLFIFALGAMKRIDRARGNISGASKLVPEGMGKDIVSGEINRKLSQYDAQVRWCFYGGIILMIAGGVTIIFSRRKV